MNSTTKTLSITLLRSILGFVILKDFLSFFFNREHLFSSNGIIAYQTYLDIASYYQLNWLCIDFTNHNIVLCFTIAGIVFSLLFTIGIFKRFSALALFILLFIFKMRAIYLLDGGDNVIAVLLPFFIFVDTESFVDVYEEWTISFKKRFEPYLSIASELFIYAIMIQICIIYFFASLHKLQSPTWADGTALYYILNSEDFSASFLNKILTSSQGLVKFLTWFTIVFQFTFPFLVWFKRTKYVVLLLGVFFHIGIFFLMRIDNFSLIMLACYFAFINDDEIVFLKQKYFQITKKLFYA